MTAWSLKELVWGTVWGTAWEFGTDAELFVSLMKARWLVDEGSELTYWQEVKTLMCLYGCQVIER